MDFFTEIEIEDRLVGDVERGGAHGERMGIRPHIQHHQGAEVAAILGPACAKRIACPRSGGTGNRPTQGDKAKPPI